MLSFAPWCSASGKPSAAAAAWRVVRRGADAAAGEHDIAAGKGALQRGGDACAVVAEKFSPAQLQAARRQQLHHFGEVLVDPFAGQDFVADDDQSD
jgi:hypothetical protein